MNAISVHPDNNFGVPEELSRYYQYLVIRERIRNQIYNNCGDNPIGFIFQIAWERGSESSSFPWQICFALEKLAYIFRTQECDTSKLRDQWKYVDRWSTSKLKKELTIVNLINTAHRPYFYLAVVTILHSRNVLFDQ